ncbi:MAG TPA: tripartite tricarboxylate transporter substrate binding protein, partial [Burkholderiales bacterium]|nr:tripartite tricarboxylate transporter substrate binding protein [Burkholderiales bacterium]
MSYASPRSTPIRLVRMAAVGAALAASLGSAPALAQWKPDRTVEIVVGSAAGGGNDKSARVIQKVWKDLGLAETQIVNRVGGGGAVAYTYVSQKGGDGSSIALAQAGLNTNHITGRSPLHYTDMTPLAFVGNEPVGLAVKADSPYKTLKDLVAQLKKDPQSLSLSTGSTRGATNHFALALLAKEAGIDPNKLKIVVFGGGAEAVTNLLGGHIDGFAVAINNSIAHHRAGTLRILAISSEKRSDDLPNVSTFREQGFNVVMEGWTVFMGPKNMPPAQVAFYEQAFAKAVNNPQWKQYLDQNAWNPGYRNSKD